MMISTRNVNIYLHFLVEIIIKVRSNNPVNNPQTGFFDILSQLDYDDPLLALGRELNWKGLEEALAVHYSDQGRAALPIRLMSGLLILKRLYNLNRP